MVSMEKDPSTIEDRDRMRVVSHPARWRVLNELLAGHTLTGTQAAELVGLTPSAMSYHLRRLAKLGLVEQVASDDGRERPWHASTDGMRMTAQPDASLGGSMMSNIQADVGRLLTTAPPAADDRRPWPAAFTHRTLRMSRAEAKQLHQRIEELIEKHAPATEGVENASGDEETFTYEVFWIQGIEEGGAETTPRRPT